MSRFYHQPDPQPMCVVQQVVRFRTSSSLYSYSIDVPHSIMKRIQVKHLHTSVMLGRKTLVFFSRLVNRLVHWETVWNNLSLDLFSTHQSPFRNVIWTWPILLYFHSDSCTVLLHYLIHIIKFLLPKAVYFIECNIINWWLRSQLRGVTGQN